MAGAVNPARMSFIPYHRERCSSDHVPARLPQYPPRRADCRATCRSMSQPRTCVLDRGYPLGCGWDSGPETATLASPNHGVFDKHRTRFTPTKLRPPVTNILRLLSRIRGCLPVRVGRQGYDTRRFPWRGRSKNRRIFWRSVWPLY